jgi:hypothetical protein
MWTVAQPILDAGQTYDVCISKVSNADFRDRLVQARPTIVTAAVDYKVKAQARSLNLVAQAASVAGVVSKKEMVSIYDQRMAGKSGPGRPIYDQIKMLPTQDRCPFCDHRNVSTLDHILPKTLYPSLAVTPLNLVAACMDCNKVRSDFAPTAPEEVPLHPYFDDVTDKRWLFAKIIQQTPCAFVFDLDPPNEWDSVTEARARRQFSLLGLPRLYSNEAARELANIRYNLGVHYQAGGPSAVRDELARQWSSRRANRLNSWQTAMYEAAVNDPWFYSGGFAK